MRGYGSSHFFVIFTSPLMRTTFKKGELCMKKVGKVIYGTCVVYLLMFNVMYLGNILYNGLESIPMYSIESGWLFVDVFCTTVVLIVYPVKQYISGLIRNVKKDIKERQKQQKKQDQAVTNK